MDAVSDKIDTVDSLIASGSRQNATETNKNAWCSHQMMAVSTKIQCVSGKIDAVGSLIASGNRQNAAESNKLAW